MVEAYRTQSALAHLNLLGRAVEARGEAGVVMWERVPPAQVAALWEHWGQPACHWLPCAHVPWFDGDALRAVLDSHLRGTLLA